MRTLRRKLFRDLWQLKAQALAISAVIGTGVAMFAMYLSTFDSLERTRTEYYERQRFADVFAGCKRAPEWLGERIAAIPDVARADTRVIAYVTLDVPDFDEPVRARLLSIPEIDRDTLNDVTLRRGRYIDPADPDEVLVHEAFATEHGLAPGDRVAAIVNGRRRELTIAGIALSPEYVYVMGPGDIVPDDRRFGVFWMARRALASAFDMEGGFNHVSIRLSPGSPARRSVAAAVIAEVDRLLEPYGGLGAIEREHQESNWFVENELREMQTLASTLPVIFLGVAAFLLNVVLSRAIAVQRTQIAALKAVGYYSREVALHYVSLGLWITGIGVVLGSIAGARLGRGLTGIYAEYFRFPGFDYELAAPIVLGAAAISLAAAAVGSLAAVRRAVRLPPAEAMRPEPPARFHTTRLERLGLQRVVGPAGRMILRNVARRPWRFALSAAGVGMAIALLVLGSFIMDALDYLTTVQFELSQRHDATVTFVEPRSSRARHELAALPGVLSVEPFRAVPVRLRYGHRFRRVSVLGLPEQPALHRIVDRWHGALVLPEHGLLLSAALGRLLGADAGDVLEVDVLEGAREHHSIPVAGLVEDMLGLSAYMRADALARLLHEDLTLSGGFLAIDPAQRPELFRRLKRTPDIAGVGLTQAALDSFRDTIQTNLMRLISFNVLFSVIIAVGVVYNAARISLSERARDLASLRVLGFTRAEITRILLGELALVTLASIPIGLACGRGLAALTLALLHNELYRIPLIIEPSTYALAVATVIVAAVASGLLVRRRLARLDLVSVLKTNE